jgi:hypothetical protein
VDVDPLQGKVIACHLDTCDQLSASGWDPVLRTRHNRTGHTSAVTPRGILLVGGAGSPATTELLPGGGGPSQEGWSLQPGRQDHCSIQLNPTMIVLTGGRGSETLVTEHSGLGTGGEVTTRKLPDLLNPRSDHACGVYTVGSSQVGAITTQRQPCRCCW